MQECIAILANPSTGDRAHAGLLRDPADLVVDIATEADTISVETTTFQAVSRRSLGAAKRSDLLNRR